MKTQWTKITENLRTSLDSGLYRIWVAPLNADISANGLKLVAPSGFVANWIKRHLLKTIAQAAAPVLGLAAEEIRIDVIAGESQAPQSAASILASA